MKNFIFLFFLALTIISCNQEFIDSTETIEKLSLNGNSTEFAQFNNSEFSSVYSDGLGLSAADMQLIGTLHNDYALKLADLMDLSCENCISEFNEILTELLKSEFRSFNYEDDLNIVEVIVDESLSDALELEDIDFNFVTWDGNHMSDEFNTKYQEIIDLVYSSNSISELKRDLNTYIELVNQSSFSIFEKEVLITSSEVARNSFELWAPVSMKGLGYLDTINGVENSNSTSDSRWCWRCAAAGDVAGLATYFTTLGVAGSITAAAIPGTNVALAAGAAGAAVGGSVVAGSGITNQP